MSRIALSSEDMSQDSTEIPESGELCFTKTPMLDRHGLSPGFTGLGGGGVASTSIGDNGSVVDPKLTSDSTMGDVVHWLISLHPDLKKYRIRVMEKRIDGETLLNYEKYQDLCKDLGVTSAGHRHLLKKGFERQVLCRTLAPTRCALAFLSAWHIQVYIRQSN